MYCSCICFDAFASVVLELPMRTSVRADVSLLELGNVEFFAEGSNSDIFTATWKGAMVILKVVKKEKQASKHVLHEFEMEFEALTRMDHPNIGMFYYLFFFSFRHVVCIVYTFRKSAYMSGAKSSYLSCSVALLLCFRFIYTLNGSESARWWLCASSVYNSRKAG
jgi:hypothetical protein